MSASASSILQRAESLFPARLGGGMCPWCGYVGEHFVTCNYKLVRDLLALLAVSSPQWQEIESAPLAKMVLLWAPGWRQPFIGARNSADFGAVFLDGVSGEGCQMYGATHWQPLPDPPSLAVSSQSAHEKARTKEVSRAGESSGDSRPLDLPRQTSQS